MSIGILINCDKNLKRKVMYTFEMIFLVLGIPFEIIKDKKQINSKNINLIIYYGSPLPIKYIEKYLSGSKCIIHIPSYWDIIKDQMPIFSHENKPIVTLDKVNNIVLISISIDLIYSIFYIVSRLEEVECKKKICIIDFQ